MIQPGEIYRHFKGGEYEIVTLAQDSDTLEGVVVYKSLSDPDKVWTRPLKDFEEGVDRPEIPYKGPRFRKIS